MLALQGLCIVVTTMHCSSQAKELSATCCRRCYHIHLTSEIKSSLLHFWRHSLPPRTTAGVWVRGLFANTLGPGAQNRGPSSWKGLDLKPEKWQWEEEQWSSSNFQKDYELLFSFGVRWERGFNYSLHTSLSSNTKTNDAGRGRLEKTPRNGGHFLGKPVYSNAQKDWRYYWEISPNRHLQTSYTG